MFAEGNVLEAANLGHPEAMGEMASNYASGNNGFDSEHEKAYAFAVEAANEGDEGVQFILGVCFQNGWVVEKDYFDLVRTLWRLLSWCSKLQSWINLLLWRSWC